MDCSPLISCSILTTGVIYAPQKAESITTIHRRYVGVLELSQYNQRNVLEFLKRKSKHAASAVQSISVAVCPRGTQATALRSIWAAV